LVVSELERSSPVARVARIIDQQAAKPEAIAPLQLPLENGSDG
jgi:hypothetical protein